MPTMTALDVDADGLPDDYPHENAIYAGHDLCELLGAETHTFEAHDGEEVTGLHLFLSYWNTDEERHRGVQKMELTYITADGGITTIYDALLALPAHRVQDREALK